MMKNNKGFTFMEVMTVVAIIGIMAAIGTPAFLKWRHESNLRGAVLSLKGDLEWAKSKAMQNNASVDVVFDASGYTITNLVTMPNKNRRLSGITVTPIPLTFTFDTRKTAPLNNGTVTFSIAGIGSRDVNVNRLGRVSID